MRTPFVPHLLLRGQPPHAHVEFRLRWEVQWVLRSKDEEGDVSKWYVREVSRESTTHFEREKYREPAQHILRNDIFPLGMNTQPDVLIQHRLKVTREAVQHPRVRDVE